MLNNPLPRRRQKSFWVIISVLFFVLLRIVWVVYPYFQAAPPIVISKATTFITEPLDKEGLPDYFEFIRQQKRIGVTPENNAVVLLAPITNLHFLDSKSRQYFFAELEIDAPLAKTKRFEELPKEWDEKLQEVSGQPWATSDFPELARWLDEQQTALDVALAASRRSHFYSPMLGDSKVPNAPPELMSVLLFMESQSRDLAKALCVRAMRHLGQNKKTAAITNLLAAAKLARLLNQKGNLVTCTVGYECDVLAMKALRTVLTSTPMKSDEAKLLLLELQQLSDWSDTATTASKQYDRMMILDVVINMKRYGLGSMEQVAGEEISFLDFITINYNVVLRDVNHWYDRLDAAAAQKDLQRRKRSLLSITEDLQQLGAQVAVNKELMSGYSKDLQKRSQLISGILACLLLPDISLALDAQDQAQTELELTRLAAALAVYRTEQSEYPGQLIDLVPGILKKLPLDLYSSKSFFYQRKDDGGYLLYSVYENEIDDLGTSMTGLINKGEWVDEASEEEDGNEEEAAEVITE